MAVASSGRFFWACFCLFDYYLEEKNKSSQRGIIKYRKKLMMQEKEFSMLVSISFSTMKFTLSFPQAISP